MFSAFSKIREFVTTTKQHYFLLLKLLDFPDSKWLLFSQCIYPTLSYNSMTTQYTITSHSDTSLDSIFQTKTILSELILQYYIHSSLSNISWKSSSVPMRFLPAMASARNIIQEQSEGKLFKAILKREGNKKGYSYAF